MKAEELVKEAKALGAKIKPIEKTCEFQKVGESVFLTCVARQEFGINLGSAGGPAVVCSGHSVACGSHKDGDITVIDYTEPKTCEYYLGAKNIIGWEIYLPSQQ